MSDDLDKTIEAVETAIKQISGLSVSVRHSREPTAGEIGNAMNGAMTILYVTVTSLASIAHHVGKLAEKDQADFEAAVANTAEMVAEQKAEERKKRNFIGQR